MRPSPFAGLPAGLPDRPSADALVLDVGGPRAGALGCFAATTLFLALVAAGALSYAAAGTGPATPRVIGWVLGAAFALTVLGLVAAAVRAVRTPRGLALDATGAWWRDGRAVSTVPWSDVAEARVISPPDRKRRQRTSAPAVPSLELCPPDLPTLRRHPGLTGQVISAEPWRDGLPALRLRFPLPPTAVEPATAALVRFAPGTAPPEG